MQVDNFNFLFHSVSQLLWTPCDQIFVLRKSYENANFPLHKSVLDTNKFEIVSPCNFLKFQTSTKLVK